MWRGPAVGNRHAARAAQADAADSSTADALPAPAPAERGGNSAWEIIKHDRVEGLYICTDFFSVEEVEVLRVLFKAQNGWSMYNWGNVGKRNELASVMQRIDFGLPEMTAEGVAAARSNVQPIGELQQVLISLLEERMRHAFGDVAWGGRDGPPHPDMRPNMLQFTRIAPGTCLGNHFDRRDKWDEGIASFAWSETHGHRDPRGDEVRAAPRRAAHAAHAAHAPRTPHARAARLPRARGMLTFACGAADGWAATAEGRTAAVTRLARLARLARASRARTAWSAAAASSARL